MNFLQIEDLNIRYDETCKDIARITTIIQNNLHFFLDVLRLKTLILTTNPVEEQESCTVITDFDSFYDNAWNTLLNQEDFLNNLENPILLPIVYAQLFILKNQVRGNGIVRLDSSQQDVLWFIAACKFYDYKTQFHEVSNFMKYRTNADEIFRWLQETQRFPTYNYLLDSINQILEQTDLSFFNNMDEIVSKMSRESLHFAISEQDIANFVSQMSLAEIDAYFLDFLKTIEAPVSWQKMYLELKEKNGITFEKMVENENRSCLLPDGTILVSNDGTINTFISLVHEFMHYVSNQNGDISFSLLEFPSLYFELVAADYLIEKGFEKEIVQNVIKKRKQNNFDIYCSLTKILTDLCDYKNNGPILKQRKIDFYRTVDKELKEARENLAKILQSNGASEDQISFLHIPAQKDYDTLVNEEVDRLTDLISQNGALILNGYQYLTDTYLASSAREKSGNTTTKMIHVTENLSDYTIESVSKYLGLEDVFTKKKNPRTKSYV